MTTAVTLDFADFNLSGDWTRWWDTPTSDWSVSSGDLSATAGAGTFGGVSWDDIADDDDVDILVKFECSTTTTQAHFAFVRGSGSAGSPQMYTVSFYGTRLRIYKFTGSETGTSLGSTACTLSSGTIYWARFRVNTDDLTAKIWADAGSESSPIATVTITDDTSITGSGSAGVMVNTSITNKFYQYGIGTNGDIAPASASSAQDLTPGLVSNTQTFHAPTVSATYGLTPGLVSNTQTFPTPTVSATYGLTPGLVSNTQTFHAPTVSQEGGAQYLVPDLVSNSQTFFAASVTPGTVTIAPEVLTNAQNFHAPTVSNGFTLTAPLVSNDQIFYAPAIGTGSANLAPALLTNAQTFYAATVSAAGVETLAPELLENTNSFYQANVFNVQASGQRAAGQRGPGSYRFNLSTRRR